MFHTYKNVYQKKTRMWCTDDLDRQFVDIQLMCVQFFSLDKPRKQYAEKTSSTACNPLNFCKNDLLRMIYSIAVALSSLWFVLSAKSLTRCGKHFFPQFVCCAAFFLVCATKQIDGRIKEREKHNARIIFFYHDLHTKNIWQNVSKKIEN